MRMRHTMAAVVAAMVLCACAARAQEANFSLSTERIYGPGEKVSVTLSSLDLDEMEFRVYRIKDPLTFFLNQEDIHNPAPVRRTRTRTGRDLIGEFIQTAKDRYRSVLRMVTGSGARGKAVEDMDIRAETWKTAPKIAPILKQYPLIKKWQFEPESSVDQWENENVDIPVKDPGVYLIEGVNGTSVAYTVAVVSRMRFIEKTNTDHKMLFVADWKTGDPVRGADVWFVRDAAKGKWATDRTGRDGIAETSRKRDDGQQVYVRNGDDFLVGDPYFYDDTSSEYSIYIYTERPVYRPGQEVFFKALARKQKDRVYKPLAEKKISVEITDARGEQALKRDIRTNEMGSLFGKFQLSPSAAVGRYNISMHIGEDYYEYASFEVQEYKKPEYSIDITTDRKSYVAGDTIAATVSARYFFGEPVSNAKAEYFIYRAKYWEPWWAGDSFAGQYSWFFAGGDGMETYEYNLVEQGTGELDAEGQLKFFVNAKKADEDSVFKIEVKITDRSRHEVAGSKVVKVAQGLFRIQLNTNRWLYKKGDDATIDVSTQSIAGGSVSAPVELVVKHVWWEQFKKRVGMGIHYDWVRKEKLIQQQTVRTNSNGEGKFDFKVPQDGSYDIYATSRDGRGNKLTASYNIYAFSGENNWYDRSGEEFKVRTDRRYYKPGEKARLVITSPIKDPTVLLTVEGDRVYERRVMKFSGTMKSVDIPIRDEYFPNVYVDVHAIRNNKTYEKEEELFVPSEKNFLRVTAKPDKEKLRPGDKVNIEVTAKDAAGNPVDAEISLGVVDEAVYAVVPETTPDIRKFFWGRRYNRVTTEYSFDFYITGYSRSYDRVMRQAARKRQAIRYAEMKTENQDRVRKEFKDTMEWTPVARTGPSGRTTVTAKCPDNLTTWRITVRASDDTTRVGQTTKKFLVRKDLILRIAAPRVFREGDVMTLSTLVHNYLKSAKKVRVSLEAKGARLYPKNVRTLNIPARGEARLDWRAEVAPGEKVVLKGAARADVESDIVEMTFPLIPHGIQRAKFMNESISQANGIRKTALTLPENAPAETAKMLVEISPSLFGLVYGSLEYLISYPYGCTEQTMSSFLPDVIAAKALKKIGAPLPPKMKELPKMLKDGFYRLNDYQHDDGGWGWWKDDATEPYMTAYVVMGLAEARDAGFDVWPSTIERGTQSLLEQLKNEKTNSTTRLYMLYALALAGNKDTSMIQKMYANRRAMKPKLNTYGLALMAMTLQRVGMKDAARKVAGELAATATTEDGLVHWESPGWKYNWEDDPLESTAQAVRALAAVRPADRRLLPAVRWLLGRRKGDSWHSTRDTALIVMAMIDYMVAKGETETDFSGEVAVNGRKEAFRFGKKNVFSPPIKLTLSGRELRRGNNPIRMSKSGKGTLYVNARLEFFSKEEPVPATDNGFSLKEEWYGLTAERQPGGDWIYKRTPLENGTVAAGKEALLEVDVSSKESWDYQMVTIPFPAGFEVVSDTRGYRIEGLPYSESEATDQWYDWYTNREVRDDRVVLFNTWYPQGNKTYYVILRAELPGEYHVMPARAELMYYPEVNGNAKEERIRVVE